MGWFFKERRGTQGWKEQTIASISSSPPPLPLLAIFGIVILFLSLSYYINYKVTMHKTEINFRLLLFLLPVILIVIARSLSNIERLAFWWSPVRQPQHDSTHRAGGSPWGVAALVVLLLVMLSYQSKFQSKWFRPFWSSVY